MLRRCTHAPLAFDGVPATCAAAGSKPGTMLTGVAMGSGRPPGVARGVQSTERPEPSCGVATKLFPTHGFIGCKRGVGIDLARVSLTTGFGSTKERGRPLSGVCGNRRGIFSGSTTEFVSQLIMSFVSKMAYLKYLDCTRASLPGQVSDRGAP